MHLTTRTDAIAVRVQQSSRVGTTVVIIGALLLVFGLDRATDAAPVQHLYYGPIILAAVAFTTRGGVLAALTSILLYHVANPHLLTLRYEEQDIVQIALFVAVGVTTAKLVRDRDRLRQLALTDDLTGLHNLRSFEARLAALVRASREGRAPLSMLVLDVDRLKTLNDHHGHLTGAEAVRTVGRIIGERLPPAAVACRYGGDEFAIAILPCPPAQAQRVAEDLCEAVHRIAPLLAGRAFPAGTLSVSVGGSCVVVDHGGPSRGPSPRDVDDGEALFRAADEALYLAKANGRNRAWVNDAAVVNQN
jgi:diguanylate cyclase (GGDEF)-like protein